MPKSVIAGCPAMPSSFSASTSAGRPWQSQPKRRSTTLAAHRLVAGHGVLDVAGQQVAVVRQAVGERRPVVEDELVGVAVRLALGDRLEERVVALPALEDALARCAGKSGCDGTRGYTP